ncbi:MAG: hypothetical protein AB1798_14865 [Spirochaetota bacterium]
MLKPMDIEKLENKVFTLLSNTGIAVENNELTEICIKKGCLRGTGTIYLPA